MKTNKIKFLAAIAIFSMLFSSCSEDDVPTVVPDTTVTGLASSRSDLTLLVKALSKAGLAGTLQGEGPFTVFAPTNTAFEAVGYNAAFIDAIPASGVPALRELLLNHVISGDLESTDLVNNTYRKTLARGTASASNTLSMYINTTSGVRLNGVSSVDTSAGNFNIIAANGVIHIVNAVITLPTIVTHAAANPNFDTLESLLVAQSLTTTLGGTASSPFTVFAPLNSAFDTATLALYTGFNSTQKTSVLTYHVIAGANVLSNAIPASSPTFETGILNFSGTVITDEKARLTNIVLTDVQCANGVIHAVDKVLLPNSVP